MVYHAYENGFYNLGRQTLLEPIEWTGDGWFRMAADPARPFAKPDGRIDSPVHGFAFSDDFSSDKMGVQWGFYAGGAADRTRYRYETGALVLAAKGTSPADSSPLSFVTGDHAYEVEVEIESAPTATAGLFLFYNRRLYVGLGFSSTNLIMHSYGIERPQAKPPHIAQRLYPAAPQRAPHRDDSLQRRWPEMGAVRPGDGGLRLPPQRRLRLPEPAAGALRRR